MWLIRIALLSVGLAGVVYGVFLILGTLPAANILGLLIWLAAVVIVHDGIMLPAVSLLRWVVFAPLWAPVAVRQSFRWSLPRSLITAAALITAIVLPEIWAQRRGTANPTILPGDYLGNLLGLWIIVLAAVAAAVIAGVRDQRPRR